MPAANRKRTAKPKQPPCEAMNAVELTRSHEESPILLYPHQIAAEHALRKAIASGMRRLALVIPTGGGKSYNIVDLAWLARQKSRRVLVLTNRRVVTQRLRTVFSDADVSLAVIDADRKQGRPYWHPIHIAMLQTLGADTLTRARSWGNCPRPICSWWTNRTCARVRWPWR